MLDSLSREGVINLNSDFYKMDFLSSLTDGVVIPSGMNIHGKAGMKGNDLFTETTLSQNEGKVQLNAEYNLLKEAYKADMQISELNLHDFLPADSLFYLSAGMQLEGAGTDIFSKRTTLTANAGLNHLQWGTRVFSGVQLNAALKESKANLNLDVNDNLMNISSQLDASLHPSAIAADMLVQVKNLDLYGMGLLSSPLKTAENIDIHLKTDMKKSHGIRLSVKDINLITEKKTFKTKDIHFGFSTARDSIRSYANAGDLTFLFRSRGGIDELGNQITKLTNALSAQWKQKSIDQVALRELWPETQFRIFAGKDNPISNTLAIKKINFNRMNVNIRTSPAEGLNASMNLYGLKTDSLALDTIYFNTTQQPDKISFNSGVVANDKPFQEAFDITLNGDIGADKANATIEYLNGKKRMWSKYRYGGWPAKRRNQSPHHPI